MVKKFIITIIVIMLLIGGFFWLNEYIYNQKQGDAGYKNTVYLIEGRSVELKNGYAEIESAPGSASKIITKYFGNEANGDLNGDGIGDITFLLTQERGGSGTFYYAAVAIATDMGYQGTNTVFLGDRIAPQSTEIEDGVITVNYAERKPGESMTTSPSVAVSKYLKVENGVLTEKSFVPKFGFPYELGVGESIVFSDGLKVVLREINDSRCKPGVVCVWAGELSPHLIISGGGVSVSGAQVILGTTTKTHVTSEGYEFVMQDATETSATVIVKKAVVATGPCYVRGCSAEVCSDNRDTVTMCEYREEYACYKTATCERQQNGQCGWTMTSQLKTCLGNS